MAVESNGTVEFEKWQTAVQIGFCCQELLFLVIILMAVYGLYQGTETQHPLYAVLFLNLVALLLFTLADLALAPFLPLETMLRWVNLSNGLSLFFHVTCWCLTSLIRYVYIEHEEWLHDLIPEVKRQCVLSVVATAVAFPVLSGPSVLYAIFYMGWPRTTPLSRPWTELVGLFTLLLISFLLPIVISCGINLRMICRRWNLHTRVGTIYAEDQVHNSPETRTVYTVNTVNSYLTTELRHKTVAQMRSKSLDAGIFKIEEGTEVDVDVEAEKSGSPVSTASSFEEFARERRIVVAEIHSINDGIHDDDNHNGNHDQYSQSSNTPMYENEDPPRGNKPSGGAIDPGSKHKQNSSEQIIPDIRVQSCDPESGNAKAMNAEKSGSSENLLLDPSKIPDAVINDDNDNDAFRRRFASFSSTVSFFPNIEPATPDHDLDLDLEAEATSRKKEKEKIEAQISAAKRSMWTNFLLASLFMASVCLVLTVQPAWRQSCFAFLFLTLRFSMPIATTIANFGTVQFVLGQYWNLMKNKLQCSE